MSKTGMQMDNKIEGFRLSPQQERLWLLGRTGAGHCSQCVIRLEGALQTDRLRLSLRTIIGGHEAFRTVFYHHPGMKTPIQVISNQCEPEWAETRLRNIEPHQRAAALAEYARAERMRPFDLELGPALRALLVAESPQVHTLILTINSLCADRWTLRNLFQELSRCYAVDSRQIDADGVVQYKQFSEWQHSLLESEDAEDAREYWTKHRPDSLLDSALPWERRSAGDGAHDAGCVMVRINCELVAEMDRAAKRYGVSTEAFLLGCLQALLFRVRSDRAVGYLTDGRSFGELHGAMGLFEKRVPISFQFRDDMPFYEVLQQTASSIEDARNWQDYIAFGTGAGPDDDAGKAAEPHVAFAFEEFPAGANVDGVAFDLCGVYVEKYRHRINLSCVRASESINAEFHFTLANLGAQEVEYLGRLFDTLLRSAIANPRLPICELNVLSENDRRTALYDFNPAAVVYPRDACIHILFEQQAARVPDRIAVMFGDCQLSYAELEARSNEVANYLTRRGVGYNARIALCLDRSIEMLVAVLGILKAGAAYVPIEEEHPTDRLAFQITAAQCSVIITEERLFDRFFEVGPYLISLDQIARAGEPRTNPMAQVSSQQPCYVIYTSGSTGSPKGVAVSHRSLINYALSICAMLRVGGDAPALRFATVSTLSADLGNTAIFPSLISGGCLMVVSRDVAADGQLFATHISERAPDVIKMVPTHLGALIESHRGAPALPGRYLVLGGEALSFDLIDRISRASNGCQVINHYGPTETTVGSLTCVWDDEKRYDLVASTVPIGRPLANTQVYVLDNRLEPVPIGVAGDIYIAGEGLALGYVQNPEQTSARFLPDPFAVTAGARFYRTGDVARRLFDGAIEFLGRMDNQVKIRGHRIELGEIESALTQHAGVREAVVTAREDEPGRKRLVAYITSEHDSPPMSNDLRSYLEQKLPDYMVPSVFVPLKFLPLTSNGKIDRRSLPAPDHALKANTDPQTEVEKILAEVWRDVLGVQRVGVRDNYFELGGDSILSLQIIARARDLGIRITPKQVFQHRTIAELAMVAGAPLDSRPEDEEIAGDALLTPIQRWFFEQDLSEPGHWNFPVLLHALEKLNPLALEDAVGYLCERHEALRYRFALGDSKWRQYLPEFEREPVFSVIDLSAILDTQVGPLIELLAAEIQASLDLSHGPLLRITLFRTADQELDRLLIVIHHLVVDGVSLRILLEELQTGYRQLTEGRVVVIPQKTTSFRRWASRLTEEAESAAVGQEAAYWLSRLVDNAELPTDYPDGVNTVASARTLFTALSSEDTEALLREPPRAYNTQINDVLLAALAPVIGDWTGRRSVALTLEGHGRLDISEDIDVSRTIGWFTTQYPVLLDVSGRSDSGELLKAVKEELRQIPVSGLGYGLLRYLRADGEISGRLQAAKKPQVKFNYLGQFDHVLSANALFGLAPENCGLARSPHGRRAELLEIIAEIVGNQLRVSWTYSENAHRQATIEELARKFVRNLKSIVSHCESQRVRSYTPSDFPLARLSQRDLDLLTSTASSSAGRPLAGVDVEDIFKLTPMQEGMLFHSLLRPETDVYFIQVSFTLYGKLDVSAFAQAWQKVTDRHAALRSGFRWEGIERPVQVIHRRVEVPLEQEDWRSFAENSHEVRLEALLRADQNRGFALSRAPLMRLRLIRLTDDKHQFIWSFHHLLLDGWSKSIVLLESLALYEAQCRNEEVRLDPPTHFRGYTEWQQRQDIPSAKAYWQGLLSGFTARTPLGGGMLNETSSKQYAVYGERRTQLSAEATAALYSMARSQDLTLNSIIQGCWAILLSRYSGEEDVVFGVTVSGRPPELPKIESMVGVFINTLPLRISVEPGALLVSWLKSLQAQQLEMRQYEYCPLSQVHQWSDMPPGESLFDSTVAFENYPVGPELVESGRMLEVGEVRVVEKNNYSLTLLVTPGAQLSLWVIFDECRIRPAMMARLLDHFVTLLEAFPEGQGRRLSTFLPLSDIERHQALVEWNDTEHGCGVEDTVYGLFESQARIRPDTIAAVFEGSHLSYNELTGRSSSLARRLRFMGVGPEASVAVLVERSLLSAVAVLAVLKAGGVYVPLDPAFPKDRIRYMLEDARAAVLLTHNGLSERLPEHAAVTIDLDSEWEPPPHSGEDRERREPTGENLCYVMYTSGSTGRPKGVALSHRNLVNLILWQINNCAAPTSARALQFAPSSFDVSFQEMFSTWCSGGTLILISEDRRRDVSLLWRFATEEGIERLFLPVVVLQHIADVDQHDRLGGCVREIVTSGAQLKILPQVAEMFARLDALRLQNQYGPSETHAVTAVTLNGFPRDWPVLPTIGRAVHNTQVYLLDRDQNPVCAGALGEINIGGKCLARGYLGRPDLTAEKFIPDPYSEKPGQRLYRSGDLANYRFDGAIEFAGRTDDQVKIRGFRVEPAEVEAVLIQHPGVREAAVLVEDDGRLGKRLVSYLVSGENGRPSASALREFLSDSLPDFMAPSGFVFLDAMPLTLNGKLDRRRLAQLERPESESTNQYVAPVAQAEQTVAEIWGELLGLDQIGVNDNFFELGGDSLLAMKVVSRLRRIFQNEFPLRNLFEWPTVRGTVDMLASVCGDVEKVEEIARTYNDISRLSSDELRTLVFEEKAEGQEA